MFAFDDDRDAGDAGLFCRTDGKALDVAILLAEQLGNMPENTRLVFYPDGEDGFFDVAHGCLLVRKGTGSLFRQMMVFVDGLV